MSILGYKIYDKKGELIHQIVGLVKKDVLNKFRRSGLVVKKIIKK